MKTVWNTAQTLGLSLAASQRRFLGNSLSKAVVFAALSVVSYFFFSRVVVTAVEVQGSSMLPTLHSGDRVLLNRLASLRRTPQRGDLVVLRDPEIGELVVKRVIALPAEIVHMVANDPVVNGHQLTEPYLPKSGRAVIAAPGRRTVVPKDHFYVLGDNRSNSVDSRVFGPVPRENIVGVIDL
jgi:signal peptidase I